MASYEREDAAASRGPARELPRNLRARNRVAQEAAADRRASRTCGSL